MKEYDVEDYYLYWVATRDKPLVIGQKVSVGLLDGRTEKFGMIFRIKNRQDPESVKEILFFNRDRKICESLRIGGSASFDVVWEDGTITSLPERELRNNAGLMLVPEVADVEEIEKASKR